MAAQVLSPDDFNTTIKIRDAFTVVQGQLQALTAELNAIKAVRAGHRPRAILPDPDKFSGTGKWDTWYPLIKAKLDIDGDALGGTDKAHFWYVYGNLESKIQALVLPLASQPNPSAQHIFDALERIHENPNKAIQAAERLGTIKQNTDSFAHFLSRFERTLHEAKALDWPEVVKITSLRAGLNKSLRDKLDVQLTVPDKYDDFVKALHQLSNRHGFGAPSTGFSSNHSRGDPMDTSVNNVTNVNSLDVVDNTEEEAREALRSAHYFLTRPIEKKD